MARHRNIVRRRQPNRSWTGIVDTANVIAGGGTKTLLGSISLSVESIDETVLRTVGLISVNTDQSAATEQQEGAIGMIVVNDLAIAAGAASIPGPLTDIGDDGWFVHVPFANNFKLSSAVGIESQDATSRYFDFKSKRIVEGGFSIALMVESTAASEGFVLNVILRQLSMVKGTG